jgi:hypothetical protein
VHGDQLLLLADGVEKAERVAAESDQRDGSEHDEAQGGSGEQPRALVPARRREQQERQHQSGRDLHADAENERSDTRAQARVCAGCERECRGERQQDRRVVVRAADGEHEQHRVQSDERRRPTGRVPEPSGGASDQCDRAETAEHGERLERPQRAADAERDGRVAEQREQRSVWRVLIRPAEKREDFVA